MITTNVLARGFDHSTVNMVVHYDTPRDAITRKPDYDSYIHRVGRAGRFGRKGVSVAFVHDQSSWFELEDIMQHFSVPIHVIPPVGIDVSNDCPRGRARANYTRALNALSRTS